jgi:predicted GNAT family N-acyltransferase
MQDGVKFAESDEEIHASYQLRYKVYVEGMGRLKDKGDHAHKELRDDLDKSARALIAVKAGIVIGTLRLFWGGDAPFNQSLKDAYHLNSFMQILGENKICIIERLMVEEAHRGSPIALQLYRAAWFFVVEHGIELVLLDCEPHHLNSYLKLGFRPFTDTYSYPGIGLVIPMMFLPGDHEHLRQVNSPFSLLIKDEDLAKYQHTEQLREIITQSSNVITKSNADKNNYLHEIYADSHLLSNDKPKIFDNISAEEIEKIVEKSHIIKCVQGDHVIEANNSAKTMFVLLSGIVEVRRSGGELQAIISPGEVIGEIAFFLRVPRSASIIAATDDVRILSLDEALMSRLLKFDCTIANKILNNLCRSLCYRVVNNLEISNR